KEANKFEPKKRGRPRKDEAIIIPKKAYKKKEETLPPPVLLPLYCIKEKEGLEAIQIETDVIQKMMDEWTNLNFENTTVLTSKSLILRSTERERLEKVISKGKKHKDDKDEWKEGIVDAKEAASIME